MPTDDGNSRVWFLEKKQISLFRGMSNFLVLLLGLVLGCREFVSGQSTGAYGRLAQLRIPAGSAVPVFNATLLESAPGNLTALAMKFQVVGFPAAHVLLSSGAGNETLTRPRNVRKLNLVN